jgi:sugar phosphate permease
MACLPLAVVFSSPFSGWILDHWNWRVMMLAEGALPFLWVVIWQVFIYDYPSEAKWLSPAELEYLESRLSEESANLKNLDSNGTLRVLFGPQVLLLSLICFLRNVGDFGFLVWFPTAIGNLTKFSNTAIGSLLTIPFIVGVIAMILASWHSDKSGERRGHMSVTFAIGGVALITGSLLSQHSLSLAFVCICLTCVGTYGCLGPFWSIPAETLPRKVVGPAIGIINGLANMGGFAGSLAVGYFKRYTGGFLYGFGFLGLAMLAASALSFFLRTAPLQRTEIAASKED